MTDTPPEGSKLDKLAEGLAQRDPSFNKPIFKDQIKSLLLELVGEPEGEFIHTEDHRDINDWQAVARNNFREKLKREIQAL